MPINLNLRRRKLSTDRCGVSVNSQLVDSLLPISATVTSIYVVVLVFVFDKYHNLEYRAVPEAWIFFFSGIVLSGSFVIAGMSTLWLLGLELDVVSSHAKLSGYALGASFVLLVVGNLFLGAFVILTDTFKWVTRLDEWIKRKIRHSNSVSGGIGPAIWNVYTTTGVTLLLLGVSVLALKGLLSTASLVVLLAPGMAVVIFGLIRRERLPPLPRGQIITIVLPLIVVWVMLIISTNYVSEWFIVGLYLVLSLAVWAGHRTVAKSH